MSVESEATHSLAREARYLHQERVITPAHRKAGEFIKTWSINPIHFTPPYDNAMVKKDIAYAEKMDSKFAALANTPEKQFYAKSATVLEALSLDGIQNGWFENQKKPNTAVRAYHTSLYDDIVNGIDIIVRFEEQGSSDYAGLAIDVTY